MQNMGNLGLYLTYNKHYCETGKDHIGVQCEHRLERNDRGDDSQALHGKTAVGESESDKKWRWKCLEVNLQDNYDNAPETAVSSNAYHDYHEVKKTFSVYNNFYM